MELQVFNSISTSIHNLVQVNKKNYHQIHEVEQEWVVD